MRNFIYLKFIIFFLFQKGFHVPSRLISQVFGISSLIEFLSISRYHHSIDEDLDRMFFGKLLHSQHSKVEEVMKGEKEQD